MVPLVEVSGVEVVRRRYLVGPPPQVLTPRLPVEDRVRAKRPLTDVLEVVHDAPHLLASMPPGALAEPGEQVEVGDDATARALIWN